MYEIMDGCVRIKLEQHNDLNKTREGTTEQLFVIRNLFHHNEKLHCAFLDLKKAYDAVWREASFNELKKRYRVPKTTVKLIQVMYKDART